MKMTRIAAVLSVLTFGASSAVQACEYDSPASSAMQNATPVPKMAFKQAAKPVGAPASKQTAAPASTTPVKKPLVLASNKAPTPKD